MYLRYGSAAVALVAAMTAASLLAGPDDWPDVVQWATTRGESLRRAPRGCPPLTADAATLPGAPDYAGVFARAQHVPELARDWRERLDAGGVAPDADERAADAAALAALDPVFRELATATAAPGELTAAASVDVAAAWSLLGALQVRAAHAIAAGDHAAALADRLGVLACGLDLAAEPIPVLQLFGFTLAEQVATSCTDAWLAALPAAARAAFAAALAAADASVAPLSQLPAAVAVDLVERLSSGRALRPEELGLPSRWLAWRHGFSLERSGRDRSERLVAAVRAFEAATPPDEPWPLRSARLRALAAAERAANADLQVPFLHAVHACEEQRGRAVAALRLLRLALALHAGGPLPSLADPFAGGPLAVAPGATVVLRSAGGLTRDVEVRR